MSKYLSINECKNGYLYIIHARNGSVGIYEEKNQWFWLSRFKFSDHFLYPEDHWDTSEQNGTVKPLKEIEKAPKFKDEKDILDYLDKKTQELCNGRTYIYPDEEF